MLQNDYLVVKIGVDTAENEPFKSGDVAATEMKEMMEEATEEVTDVWAEVRFAKRPGAWRGSFQPPL